MSLKKKTPYFKLKPSEVDTTPSFQSRKTLADVVKFNMQTIGRRFYYQRLVLITKHENTSAPFLKDVFAKPISKSKCTAGDEKMTALFLLFDSYTLQMLEGPEEMINFYIQDLASLVGKVIKKSRIVLNYTNINQKFFRRIVWRIAEFPSSIEKVPASAQDPNLHRCQNLIFKLHDLCKKVREEEMDESAGFKSSYLSGDLKKATPDAHSLDAILDMEGLQSISDYHKILNQIPAFDAYGEDVWPIPHDFIPSNAFDFSEYDINLNFWQKS